MIPKAGGGARGGSDGSSVMLSVDDGVSTTASPLESSPAGSLGRLAGLTIMYAGDRGEGGVDQRQD